MQFVHSLIIHTLAMHAALQLLVLVAGLVVLVCGETSTTVEPASTWTQQCLEYMTGVVKYTGFLNETQVQAACPSLEDHINRGYVSFPIVRCI